MSRTITLTLLKAAVLTTGLCGVAGCGRRGPADHTWYDARGNPVAETWTTDAAGKRVPTPHPFDRTGRAWVYDANGILVPPLVSSASSGYRRSGVPWLWGGSGYRSLGASSSPPVSHSSPASSPSVSRGGFGSTGAHVSSSGG